ncbi:hypothetical protein PGB90_005793 [Kerria lacca]
MVSCGKDLEISGNIVESSSNVDLRSSRTALLIFSISSSIKIEGLPLFSSSCTDVRPFLNARHHLYTLVRLIAESPYTFLSH